MNRRDTLLKRLIYSSRSEKMYFIILLASLVLGSTLNCSSSQPSSQQSSSSSPSRFPTEEIAPIKVPFDMPQLKRPIIPSREFSIVDAGAKEGGTVKCTEAIQATIMKAAKAGGGTVVVPKGIWLTGALKLESNINLHLEKDAELRFSQDFSDYLPAVFSRHEDVECYKYSAFIYAYEKENIAITGEGKLNGQGKVWWGWKQDKTGAEKELYDMGNKGIPVKERIFDGSNGRRLRPAFFQPISCKNILVEGVTFLYGAFWTITPTYCENIIVRKITIVTEGEYGHTPNGDGVNPSSSRNVLIEDCIFDTGDDCIAIKAGRDNDGLRVNKPTENIVVRNCKGLRGHGGIVIGSETSGSVRNIYAENSEFNGTDRIVRLKTARGRGGVLENMWFNNLSGEDIQLEAIHLNMLYTGKRLPQEEVTPTTPRIRNINFDNIRCISGKTYAVELLGLPEMLIENITFNRIQATTEKGVHFSDVKGIVMKNSSFKANSLPLISIMNGQDVKFEAMEQGNDVTNLLLLEGEQSSNIIFKNTPIANPEKAISLGEGVSKQAVKVE